MLRMLGLAALGFTALAQSPVSGFAELKAALGLSDSHMQRVAQMRQAAAAGAGPRSLPNIAAAVLTPEQWTRLAHYAEILTHQNGAMQLVSVGAITCDQWPGICACMYPIRRDETGLGLSEDQVHRFEELRIIPYKSAADPSEKVARRQRVLAVLDAFQQAKLAAFEADLRVAQEAIDAGLLPNAGKGGEVLCN
jgi:hypothetical protein